MIPLLRSFRTSRDELPRFSFVASNGGAPRSGCIFADAFDL